MRMASDPDVERADLVLIGISQRNWCLYFGLCRKVYKLPINL
jgi:hypothetical protein